MPQVRILSLGPPFSEKPPFRRFFFAFYFVFVLRAIAVQRWFQGKKSVGSTSEESRRNLQIPNPSLIGVTAVFSIADTTNS